MIASLFQGLKLRLSEVTEQYVLISTASPFDCDFAGFANNYPPENLPLLSWISFWFFILPDSYPFVPKLYFFQSCFQKWFCSYLMGSVSNVWAEIEEMLCEKWMHLNGEVSCEQKWSIVSLWNCLCYFISMILSIFFKTFQNDIKQPGCSYELEEVLSSPGRLMEKDYQAEPNKTIVLVKCINYIKETFLFPSTHYKISALCP